MAQYITVWCTGNIQDKYYNVQWCYNFWMAERLNCVLSNIYISTYIVEHDVTLQCNTLQCMSVFVCTRRYDCVVSVCFPQNPQPWNETFKVEIVGTVSEWNENRCVTDGYEVAPSEVSGPETICKNTNTTNRKPIYDKYKYNKCEVAPSEVSDSIELQMSVFPWLLQIGCCWVEISQKSNPALKATLFQLSCTSCQT